MRKRKQDHKVGSHNLHTYDMRDAVGEFSMQHRYIAMVDNDILSGGLTTHVIGTRTCDTYRATGIK